MKVKIDRIVIHEKRRRPKDLGELINSISELGLLNPITLTEDYRLVAGLHRLEACKELGWSEIEATIVSLEGLKLELAEIDENLIRNDLTKLERGEQVNRRKAIYEGLYPETKREATLKQYRAGTNSDLTMASATDDKKTGDGDHSHRLADSAKRTKLSFIDDTSAKTGQSPRTIRENVQIASSIDKDVKELIRDTPIARSKSELLALARVEPAIQREVVDKVIKGEARNVRAIIDNVNREYHQVEGLEIRRIVEGRFGVLVVDPPWPYITQRETPINNGLIQYPSMSLEEIAAMPIPTIADNSCVLWFWTTHTFMKEALEIAQDHWGFNRRSILVWVKDKAIDTCDLKDRTEFCLLLFRGSATMQPNMEFNVLEANIPKNSHLPDEFFFLVDTVCWGPKCEVFSQGKRPGWTTLSGKFDALNESNFFKTPEKEHILIKENVLC